MAAKLIKPKSVRGVRREMQCNGRGGIAHAGVKGCGATFTFVPSDCRVATVGDRVGDGHPRYKVLPVERQVRCPACRRMSLVEAVSRGVKYTRRELDIMEAVSDPYGRGQGGH